MWYMIWERRKSPLAACREFKLCFYDIAKEVFVFFFLLCFFYFFTVLSFFN